MGRIEKRVAMSEGRIQEQVSSLLGAQTPQAMHPGEQTLPPPIPPAQAPPPIALSAKAVNAKSNETFDDQDPLQKKRLKELAGLSSHLANSFNSTKDEIKLPIAEAAPTASFGGQPLGSGKIGC